MIRKLKELETQEVKNLRNGNGVAKIQHIIKGEELKGRGKMFSKITLPKGASIGLHDHTDDFEVYYILQGKGLIDEGSKTTEVEQGDSIYTANGESHSIQNIGETDLELIAVVIYE